MSNTLFDPQESAGTLTARQNIRVEWGHCDPARIIYNPNYFRWMETGVALLFGAAGINLEKLTREDLDFRAVPLVNTEAAFLAPAHIGDFVTHTVWISRWGAKAFDIEHRFSIKDRLLVRAKQVRVWARALPGDPDSLRSIPVPQDIRAALSEPRTVTLRMAFENKDQEESHG